MSSSQEDYREKLKHQSSIFLKILYGLPRSMTSLVLGLESFSIYTLYVFSFKLHPLLVGIALACGYISIALGQFLIGWLSDLKYTKLGRRKPYILLLSPLLGASFIFLFLPNLFLDITNDIMLFIWLLLFEILFRFSYSVTTPYQAWMAEIFKVEERPEVSQIQNIFNYIGTGLMGILVFFVFSDIFSSLKTNIHDISLTYSLVIIIIGILTISLFYLLVLFFPREKYHSINTNLKENLHIILQNTNFLRVVFMHGFSGIAWSIIASGILTYNQEVLGLQNVQYLLIGAVLAIGTLTFLYLWRKKIEQKGKKKSLLIILIIAICSLPSTLLGLLSFLIPPIIIGIIFTLFMGLINAGWNLFPYIIYADISQDENRESGNLLAGTYTGFPFLVLNLFQAVGILLLGMLTSLKPIDVGAQTFSFGLTLWGPICALILLISYFFTKKQVILDFQWEEKTKNK
ncbi:MAG: Major Facilitator Superfamily protein (modular protein) [Promethearchaeota archaeon]|nr:MAG: Major Facilitator Superfamily protein (modular protein) [Candidatus Lokiarchaeota archaeon]